MKVKGINIDFENLKYFIQPEIISSRSIIAIMVIMGYIYGQIDQNVAGYIIAFYFGSNVVTQINKKISK